MFNSIEAIKQQNIFRVQPIKWNEPNKQEQETNPVKYGINSGIYTPEHPNMQSPQRANRLDMLA